MPDLELQISATQEAEEGGSRVPDLSKLQNEFKAILGDLVRAHLKI